MEELLSVLKDIRACLQSIDEKMDYVRDDVNVMCGVLNDLHGEDAGVTLPELYERVEDVANTLRDVCRGTTLEDLNNKMAEVADAIERQ